MKNDFNVKAISQLMGHAKEIITADIYGDTQEIIKDCLEVLEPFIERFIPKEKELENDFYIKVDWYFRNLLLFQHTR